MQFLILHVDNLIGKDIPISIILELILTNLAYMVVLAAPMAVLVSTLMAFGKFSELNELTAVRSSGVNPIAIILPVLSAAIIMSLVLTWFSDNVLPEANTKARSLFIDIRVKKPGFELQKSTFYNGVDGYTFLVKDIDPETDSLYNITLFQQPRNGKKRAYIKADSGFLMSEGNQGLTMMLHNGEILQYQDHNNATGDDKLERTHFNQYRMTFDLSDLAFTKSDPSQRSRSDRTMSSQAMAVVVDTLSREVRDFVLESAERNSTKNLYEPPALEGRAKVRSIFIPDTTKEIKSSVEESFSTEFLTLQVVRNNDHRQRLLDVAHTRIEDHKSAFEQATTNIEWRNRRISRFMVEIYKKFSIPFACVVFVLLGAPIGIMTKRGNFGYAAIISAVILTFYWISIIQGEKLADRLFITPFIGMWAFNIVFSIVGIFLIGHLTTEISFRTMFRRRV